MQDQERTSESRRESELKLTHVRSFWFRRLISKISFAQEAQSKSHLPRAPALESVQQSASLPAPGVSIRSDDEGKRRAPAPQRRAALGSGRSVCREPTWCSSSGREAAAGRERWHCACRPASTLLQADPAGWQLGPIAAAAPERPLICSGPREPTPRTNRRAAGRTARPIRARRGREPCAGNVTFVVLDRQVARGGDSGTAGPSRVMRPLGERAWRQPGIARSGCRPGDTAANLAQAGRQLSRAPGKEMPFCVLRSLCTVKC